MQCVQPLAGSVKFQQRKRFTRKVVGFLGDNGADFSQVATGIGGCDRELFFGIEREFPISVECSTKYLCGQLSGELTRARRFRPTSDEQPGIIDP